MFTSIVCPSKYQDRLLHPDKTKPNISPPPLENWRCLKCGNCCRFSVITLTPNEYTLFVTLHPQFADKVCPLEEWNYIFFGVECPFFSLESNLCSIEREAKPFVCKLFPLTYDSKTKKLVKSGLCQNSNPLSPQYEKDAKQWLSLYEKEALEYKQKKPPISNNEEFKLFQLQRLRRITTAYEFIQTRFPEFVSSEIIDNNPFKFGSEDIFMNLPIQMIDLMVNSLKSQIESIMKLIENLSFDLANGKKDQILTRFDEFYSVSKEIIETGKGKHKLIHLKHKYEIPDETFSLYSSLIAQENIELIESQKNEMYERVARLIEYYKMETN